MLLSGRQQKARYYAGFLLILVATGGIEPPTYGL